MEAAAAPLIRNGLAWGGFIRSRHRRAREASQIRVHRNTTADLYRAAHLGFRGSSMEAIYRFTREELGWTRSPYHLVVAREPGEGPVIHQAHPLDVVTPHAKGVNHIAVGVAIAHDCRKSPPDPEMLAALTVAVGTVLVALPDADILPHRADGEPDDCPGAHLDVGDLAENARAFARRTTLQQAEANGLLRRRGW